MKPFLSRQLYQLRKKRKLRQEDIAIQLHMGRQTYGSYENGTRTPPLETVIQLADFYQVPVDYLIREDGPQKLSELMYPLSDTEKGMMITYRSLPGVEQKSAVYFINFLASTFPEK